MPTHWILRVGNGDDFSNGRPDGVWGVEPKWRTFIETASHGDTLWFIRTKEKGAGNLVGMGKFLRVHRPDPQPLIPVERDAEYYGWNKFTVLVYYDNFYDCGNTTLTLQVATQTSISKGEDKHTLYPGGLSMLENSIKMFANITYGT